jgi:hypothetical protein
MEGTRSYLDIKLKGIKRRIVPIPTKVNEYGRPAVGNVVDFFRVTRQ